MYKKITRRVPLTALSKAKVPAAVVEWFSGETNETPWEILLPPGDEMGPTWWRLWRREHRRAKPPAGSEMFLGLQVRGSQGDALAQAIALAKLRDYLPTRGSRL